MCTVSTTSNPALRRAMNSSLYFALFLLTAFSDCRSEVHANSPMRILTALRTPSGDTQCVTGPSGGQHRLHNIGCATSSSQHVLRLLLSKTTTGGSPVVIYD
eukprot:8040499-Pyramimonas_sp.AAC.1